MQEGTYRLTIERADRTDDTKPPVPEAHAVESKRGGSFLIFLIVVVLLVVALFAARHWLRNADLFTLLAATLGGLLHEVVQSGGMIGLPRRLNDGVYLGSLTGAVVGALVGVTAIATGVPNADTYSLAPALGGFGLKGGVEALVAQQDVRAQLKLKA